MQPSAEERVDKVLGYFKIRVSLQERNALICLVEDAYKDGIRWGSECATSTNLP